MEYLRILAAICVIFGYVSSEPRLAIDISSREVAVGADVTVRCRIAEHNPNVFLNWNKRQGEEMVQMGTNSFINEAFDNGRYVINLQDVPDEVIFVMDITGVQPEDSGEIGCSIPTIAGSEVYETLTVITPVTTVELLGLRSNESDAEMIREYTDGEEVAFSEGDQYFFACRARGSNPAADIAMTIGPKDITDLFRKEDTAALGEGKPGLRPIEHETVVKTSSAVVISFEQNTHRFGCSASTPGTDPQEIGIKVVLQFPPKMACEEKLVPVNTKDVVLKCSVRADPPIEHMSVTWKLKDNSNVTLNDKGVDGHYRFHIETGTTPDEKVAVLTIDRAFPQTFRTYYVVAYNKEETSTGEVTLHRDYTAEVISLATQNTVSILCLITALFAAIKTML